MNLSELTQRYFETAAGAGVLTGQDVHRGAAGDRSHGTWVQFDVQSNLGVVQAARFQAFGCPHTIAVSAWIVEHGLGPLTRAALPESVQQLSRRFEVPAQKRGRLLIIEDAWVAALSAALQRDVRL